MNALKADRKAYLEWLEWTIADVLENGRQGRRPTHLPPYMAFALIDRINRMSA